MRGVEFDGELSFPFDRVIPSQDVKWLAGPDSTESCVVYMRAMNKRPTWPRGRTARFAYGPDSSTPAMAKNAFETTWDTLALGPVDYRWDERFDDKSAKTYRRAVNEGLGWGGWVQCGKSGVATIPSEYVPLTPVPGVLGPAKSPWAMDEDEPPEGEPGRTMPGLVFWVWAVVFIVFIAMTVFITLSA
ncbi:MAG: hypothetical protein FJW92_01495 [Actinobacteria bacterium]|nr:hypothetical protein [Actinomycetota bacterium]